MKTLAELRAERAKLVLDMRAILDKAEKEKRAVTTDEDGTYRKLEADVDRLAEEIKAGEERMARAEKLAKLEADVASTPPPASKPTPGTGAVAPADNRPGSEERKEAFRVFLRGGPSALQVHLATLTPEQRQTLQADLMTKGGSFVAPQEFIAELIKGLDDAVFVRRYARAFRIGAAASLGVPTLDADVEDLDWTAELLTGNQGTITTGKRELRPHPMAKRIKVSKALERVSAIPIDQLVRERLTYKVGITQEKAYLVGDGVQKPLGVFVASSDGIPTSRDVQTGSATDFTGDGLIDAKHTLKSQYWPLARWAFHRTAIAKIRKIKAVADGQYIWQPGLASGQPDRLLDLPLDVSEYVPNTFTTGLYVGILAWWPGYWYVDALDMAVQFLDQLYAETNQNGYIARYEGDAAPVLPEGFVRLKTN